MLLTREEPEAPVRVWALLGARAGDNDQVLALAEALGLPFEAKQLRFNGFRRLGPKFLGKSLLSLTGASRDAIMGEPPPDLTISVGHRSVPAVRMLRDRSRGRTRSIHIGFPRASPGEFDLVIATPQYPNGDHPNLLRVPFALTRVANRQMAAGNDRLTEMPAPRGLMVVGGPTSFWRLDEKALRRTLATMLDQARGKGSLMVTTSPRTPNGMHTQIAAQLQSSGVPYVLGSPGAEPTYTDMLAAADCIRVTADSVAMVSDAIWTGKPVGLVPLIPSVAGRSIGKILDLIRPGRPRYPRDLRFFWRGLSKLGLEEDPSLPNIDPSVWKARILKRARAIVEKG